jgi:hypothetical protein
MEDLNLEIEDVHDIPQNANTKENRTAQNKKRGVLADLDVQKIAREFTKFTKDQRIVVIPIGFPLAGKSLLLSSLMYYARKSDDALFKTRMENDFPFDGGRMVVDQMINRFDKGELWDPNAVGALDLIGITIQPSKSKLPNLNLAFLDLAGEDIKNIKTSEGAAFTEKIDAIFNGLKIDNTPIIFTLITPFEPGVLSGESIQDAHDREDALHYDFLNYIEVNQPQLLKNSKFFIMVSQWDKNPDEKANVEDFIRTLRPSIYGFVKNAPVIWGEYSIGQLLVSKIGGVNVQEIVRINYDYPSRFWKKLYNICTGKNLDQKTWLEKLFG